MFGKNKKIKFQPFSIQAENLFDHPTPAVKNIPSWYKNQKLYSNGESDYVKANKKSEFKATFKLCTPSKCFLTKICSALTCKLPRLAT